MGIAEQWQAFRTVCAAPIPATFLALAAMQSAIVITIQSIVLNNWLGWLLPNAFQGPSSDTVATNLFLLIFGLGFELLYVYDAILSRSTVQVVLSCLLNAGLTILAVIQIPQVGDAVVSLKSSYDINADPVVNHDFEFWTVSSGLLIAIVAVLALFSLVLPVAAWYLRVYFSWQSYRNVNPDARLRRSRLVHQSYVMLVKLDVYFIVCFIVIYCVLVLRAVGIEFVLHVVGALSAIAILVLSIWSSKTEHRLGMSFAIVVYIGGLAYFIYRLITVYSPGPDHFRYGSASRLLTIYGGLGMIFFTLTIVNAVYCMLNFGSGLKMFLKDYEEGWKPARQSALELPIQYTQYNRSMERDLDS
ncbi:uncharacterized protein B0I36DRAFT_164840 [Microdochium trichocladiopsis]|uniref:Transmembrane protein n=1 Tax=Microdochium trichocladiopsis TaxID=1682393 RepID=A0A9P8Y125_9PEZI|nr:uncharacterized protein B0I36DRAFT_164840 [Microdochium trichocladiopsis]KAH7024891.1 hypothetical protein B0I36DRAFT_164840 [Microdochium trichocladiopsis]